MLVKKVQNDFVERIRSNKDKSVSKYHNVRKIKTTWYLLFIPIFSTETLESSAL